MFEDGKEFDAIFETEAGIIRAYADVHVSGSHLVLDELLIFPRDRPFLKVGVPETLQILSSIRALARDSGFEKLTVIYHRIGGKHDGRTIVRTRTLR
jgi:hypothetical protein